jgi:hypothetical protein
MLDLQHLGHLLDALLRTSFGTLRISSAKPMLSATFMVGYSA